MNDVVPTKLKLQDGWYTELTNAQYHGSVGYSSSFLKKLQTRTLAHMDAGENFSTKATSLGTAFHTLTLEPEKLDREIVVMPELNLRTKAGKEKKDELLAGLGDRAMVDQKQMELAVAMAEAALADPIAGQLLSDIHVEQSIFWTHEADSGKKLQLKVRPDALYRPIDIAIDLKSTQDASYDGFIRSINKYGYDFSSAMYLRGINQCRELLDACGQTQYNRFVYICVESAPPHLVAVYELSQSYIEVGDKKFRLAIRNLSEALESGNRGYPHEIRVIEPPAYADRGFTI